MSAGMLILGGGMAAAHAARQLRTDGYEGPVTIVAGEPHYPYQRPPLSKEYLQGKATIDKVYIQPEAWYAERNIEVLTGSPASAIDPKAHQITLSDGRVLGYDKLLIATGSTARKLPIPGADLPGVYTLRSVDDSQDLHEQLASGGKNLVLIGSGWIGMEVAASAVGLGNQVTVLERGEVPLQAVLGTRLGKDYQQVHEAHGVVFRMDASVDRIVGADHVQGVVVDGQTIAADLVLVGVGAVPNVSLAQDAGLAVDNGILVDAALATSDPDIFAAGDVANIDHAGAGRRLRTEHWMTALKTGKAAAKSMLGEPVSYAEIPYFYSDQYDLGMELSGYPHLMAEADIVIRGDLPGHKYLAFWVKDHKVVGGMNVNIWKVNPVVQKLIRSQVEVTTEQLTDPDVALESLLPQE